MSAPFQLSVSLSEAEYEKYGPVLQKVLVNLLSDSPFGELNRSKQMENFPEKVPDLTKSAFWQKILQDTIWCCIWIVLVFFKLTR